MVDIILHGCNGKMGKFVTMLAEKDETVRIVAGVDKCIRNMENYPIFSSLLECSVSADVVIDFSDASGTDELLRACEEKAIPLVLCTTGLSTMQQENIEKFAKKFPVLQSANMSIGITILLGFLKKLGKELFPKGYDVEIIEKHHRYKKDVPSGTAIALKEALGEESIPILSVRSGTIVGEHKVEFAGEDEVIEIKHTAYSKTIFAKGALEAAKFLAGQEAGLYTMGNVFL